MGVRVSSESLNNSVKIFIKNIVHRQKFGVVPWMEKVRKSDRKSTLCTKLELKLAAVCDAVHKIAYLLLFFCARLMVKWKAVLDVGQKNSYCSESARRPISAEMQYCRSYPYVNVEASAAAFRLSLSWPSSFSSSSWHLHIEMFENDVFLL